MHKVLNFTSFTTEPGVVVPVAMASLGRRIHKDEKFKVSGRGLVYVRLWIPNLMLPNVNDGGGSC